MFIKRAWQFVLDRLVAGIPFQGLRRAVRYRLLQRRATVPATHKKYGRIWFPPYNLGCELLSREPELYNAQGERLRSFFIRDFLFAHNPEAHSKHFLWNRYDFGLKTHFYTHWSMLETMGRPEEKFGWLLESEALVPGDYRIFQKHKTLNREFTAVFTFSEQVLNSIDNAVFFPGCAQVWYGQGANGGTICADACERKTKNISIVSSFKTSCALHEARVALARKFKAGNLVDAFGTFDGGAPCKIADSLTDYRYSVIVENYISPYFFTEKITNCFAAMTVPVYVGASKINEFFNEDGIIRVRPEDLGRIDTILAQCGEKDYAQRLPAIRDNYQRAQRYLNVFDYLYEEYRKVSRCQPLAQEK